MKLKEQYNKLKSNYGLPDYNELNMCFHIENIDAESELILQEIRGKIQEKIEHYVSIIEAIVQPETNLVDMYETKYVNDNTKETAYTLFKNLMLIKRKANLASINNTNEETADFIKETFVDYKNLKPIIFKHVEKLKNAWQKETNMKNDLSYFG